MTDLNPFAIGAMNLAVGFGAGWFCRSIPSKSNHKNTKTNTNNNRQTASPQNFSQLLDLANNIGEYTLSQSQACQSLRILINENPDQITRELTTNKTEATNKTNPTDKTDPLEPHAKTQHLYRTLLNSYAQQLHVYDPQFQVIPKKLSQEIAGNQRAITQLTDELNTVQNDPAAPLVQLISRLTELEENNLSLRDDVHLAKQTIMEKNRMLESAESIAYEDFLTNLPNRRAFDKRLIEMQATFERHQQTYFLMLIDLDHFKTVNDTHGHDAGDAVLKVAAHIIQDTCRTEDSVARYGGEEFAVLTTNCQQEGAVILAERIRDRVGKGSVRHNGIAINVTCSIGLAQIGTGITSEQLIRSADEALYAAKDNGRNNVQIGKT